MIPVTADPRQDLIGVEDVDVWLRSLADRLVSSQDQVFNNCSAALPALPPESKMLLFASYVTANGTIAVTYVPRSRPLEKSNQR